MTFDRRVEFRTDSGEEPNAKSGSKPSTPSFTIVSIGRIGVSENDRWGAGLPGLRFLDFQSLELISGDLKRFKGVSLDLNPKLSERGRVNHLSS